MWLQGMLLKSELDIPHVKIRINFFDCNEKQMGLVSFKKSLVTNVFWIMIQFLSFD